jgi:hypothetical protein
MLTSDKIWTPSDVPIDPLDCEAMNFIISHQVGDAVEAQIPPRHPSARFIKLFGAYRKKKHGVWNMHKLSDALCSYAVALQIVITEESNHGSLEL